MKTLTLKGQPVTERILERREQFFSGLDKMTAEQVAAVDLRWHAIAGRYTRYLAKAFIRQMAEN